MQRAGREGTRAGEARGKGPEPEGAWMSSEGPTGALERNPRERGVEGMRVGGRTGPDHRGPHVPLC